MALMAELPEASVDAIVTDPPYGLEFMGKGWDKLDGGADVRQPFRGEVQTPDNPYGRTPVRYGYDNAPKAMQEWHEAWAREALRVLKPGGHLLAFGGSRTYHRLACAIEDAGFEIRDCLAWLYGSGFPKSLDVSKAIDKRGGANIGWFGPWLRDERTKRGISARDLCAAIGEHGEVNHGGAVSNWEKGHNLPTAEQFNKLCDVLSLPFDRIEEAERAKTGEGFRIRRESIVQIAGESEGAYDLTAPATPEAQQWQGWGTALKPAHEPIVMARKPLAGTVARNVLEHGTGALNVDGCRIEGVPHSGGAKMASSGHTLGAFEDYEPGPNASGNPSGRWPANVLLDEQAAEMLGEESRFLYTPKASSAERSAGLGGVQEGVERNSHPT